jgi:hypothetical protein
VWFTATHLGRSFTFDDPELYAPTDVAGTLVSRKPFAMPLPLFLLAVVAMIGLAILRLVRVRTGRTPLPDGKARAAFVIVFLVVPPVALKALLQPTSGGPALDAIVWVPLYGLMVAFLVVLMTVAAMVVERIVHSRWRRPLMLALVGSEGDPEDVPYDPPLTTKLVEGMALVDRRNAKFPRGVAFPGQVERADFAEAWDALDDATRALEDGIAADRRLGLGIATAASATALDARGRLDTLSRLANARGAAASA